MANGQPIYLNLSDYTPIERPLKPAMFVLQLLMLSLLIEASIFLHYICIVDVN